MYLCTLHRTTCKDEGVVAHVCWVKGFSGQVRNPVMELVVICHDQAVNIVVKVMSYGEGGVASII